MKNTVNQFMIYGVLHWRMSIEPESNPVFQLEEQQRLHSEPARELTSQFYTVLALPSIALKTLLGKRMYNPKLKQCPVCEQNMEQGFSVRNYGLSWVSSEKMRQFAFMDKDLNEAGFKKYLPAKAEYDLSYNCANCKIYIVDYSKSISRTEANELAQSLENLAPS